MKVKTEKSRGLLTSFPADRIRFSRFHCCEALAPFVEHYWAVQWQLRGRPDFVSQNVPHPSVNLSFEKEGAMLTGVMTSVFTKRLSGNEHVFAVKFLPAGFHAFFKKPVALLSDHQVKASLVFGKKADDLGRKIYAARKMENRLRLAEEFLLSLRPQPDPPAAALHKLLEKISRDRQLSSVEQLAQLNGVSVRSLQRSFRQYIGVSPKWVIRRYRLHDAVEKIKTGGKVNFSALAHELGYADQAHFIRDFRKIVGQTPAHFSQAQQTTGNL